jgi:hypothetical protein
MDWVEKLSLYVFNSRNDFIEFVRAGEGHDVEPDVHFSIKLGIPEPYLAVVDPSGGKKEEPAARRRARGKRGEEKDSNAIGRTLLGLMTEALGSGAIASAGNTPRWLQQGVGSYLASRVEPSSPYFQHLRQTAQANYQQGWLSKANEVLGDSGQMGTEDVHAISFALVEAMWTSNLRQGFPAFVHGMFGGTAKLDDVLERVYSAKRDEFIEDTGEWVAEHYGQLR